MGKRVSVMANPPFAQCPIYQQYLTGRRLSKGTSTAWKESSWPGRAAWLRNKGLWWLGTKGFGVQLGGKCAVEEREQFLLVVNVYSSSLGCEVYSDRRVSGSRSRTAELLGPGGPAE